MSIWKSPVFYFGIMLVLVVASALAAPFVVPWNNYRDDLEAYGQKLTGRDVSIDGNIAVRLFPWPRLEARDVAIGNPAGFSEGGFVKTDVVRVTLSLAGLFNGGLDVESVEVEKPVVNLQRNASGDVNWIFAPTEQVSGQGLLARVKLDQILLKGGLVSFDDLRNGYSTVVTGLDATLSAQSIRGPWRMRGDARWRDVPMAVTVTTSEKLEGQALKFGLKVTPTDAAYSMAALDGEWTGEQFKGAVRVDPQESAGEKLSAEGAFKPLAMQADIEASTERMSLLKIKIAPADRKDSGTLIEGAAVVEFGSEAQAKVDLKSPRINMDTLVGSSAMRQWRDGGFLQVANQLLANMPAKLTVDYGLNVSVLTSGGQALNEVRLTGSVQKEAIRVKEFAADLPGRSAMLFDGVVFPGSTAAQLGGKFKFESNDSRAFVSWLAPDWRAALEQHWTGSRGRLTVQAGTVDWVEKSFALTDVIYQFDGSPGTASLSAGLGQTAVVDVMVDAGQLDIDSLVPNGWSFVRDGGLASTLPLMAQDESAAKTERRFALRSSSVLLNGVTAQDVAVTLVSGPKGFEVKLLDIGNVGGARLQGGGALVDQGDGPEGELNFHLDAQDPRGFLRLTGLEYGKGNWTEALGQTSFDAKMTAVPQKSGPELQIVARGSSGALNAELVATVREFEMGRGTSVAASGGLNSADSAAIARLVGVTPVTAVGPGDVTFEFNGSLAEGFVFSTTLKALDAVGKLDGTADVKQPYLGVAGRFSLSAADGLAMVQATGLPLEVAAGQQLDISSVVAAKDGGLSLLDLKGNVAGRRFSGELALTAEGRMQGDLETDSLDVREALALAFMPWDGRVTDGAAGFADVAQSALRGEVFLRPLLFETGTGDGEKEVVIGFGFEELERRLSMSSPGRQGVKADIALTPRGASYDLGGNLRWPIDLAILLRTTNDGALAKGSMLVEATFKTTGRSPAAVLAALEGKGSYALSGVELQRLTLDGFATRVLQAKTPEALSQALANLDALPGVTIGQRVGNVTIMNGEAVFTGISPVVDGVTATVEPRMDLTSGVVTVATSVALTGQTELPPVTITYSGEPGAMDVRNGSSALAAKLGYELLSKEMAELERLQKEQQALVVKEELQRKEDEKRFADYQATRAELREQTRLRRFQTVQREKRAAELQAIVDSAIKNGPAMTRVELQRHARRLEIRRQTLPVVPVVPLVPAAP